jgi:hypothetical protein
VSQWRAGQEAEEKEDEEGLDKVLSSAPTRRLLPVALRDLRIILLLLILLKGGAKSERSLACYRRTLYVSSWEVFFASASAPETHDRGR